MHDSGSTLRRVVHCLGILVVRLAFRVFARVGLVVSGLGFERRGGWEGKGGLSEWVGRGGGVCGCYAGASETRREKREGTAYIDPEFLCYSRWSKFATPWPFWKHCPRRKTKGNSRRSWRGSCSASPKKSALARCRRGGYSWLPVFRWHSCFLEGKEN